MPLLTVENGTTLFYDTLGPDTGAPLVLIEGLTAQMIKWRPQFANCSSIRDSSSFVSTTGTSACPRSFIIGATHS